MKRKSLILVVFVIIKIVFLISIILLNNALHLWISDGELDGYYNQASAFSQNSDKYMDGHNFDENYSNSSSNNQTNSDDIDGDGIENNLDIYDRGNSGIKVYIDSFNGDGNDYTYFDFNVWWDTSDPFFEIELQCYDKINSTWKKVGYKKSKTYWDKKDIFDPLCLIVDIDEDTAELLVKIFAKDYVNIPDHIDRGRIPDTDRPIDISSHMNQDYISVYFYPKQNTFRAYNESGDENSDNLRKGSIEFHIEVIGL